MIGTFPNNSFRTEIDSILLDASGVKDLSSVSNYLIFDIYNNSNDNNAANSYPFVALRDSNGKQIAGWCTTSYTYNGVDSYINKDKKGKWVTVCVDLSKLKGNTKNGANDPSNFDFSKVKNIWIGYWASGTIYLDNVIFSSRPEMPSNITTKVESITNTNFTTVSNLKYDEDAKGTITKDKEMEGTGFKLKDNYTATFYDKFQKNTQVIGKETEDDRFNTTWITKDLSGTEETVLGTGTGIITDPFTISTDHKDTTHMTHYIKFTNSVKTSDLSIEKKLSDDSVTDDRFKFKVIFKNIFGSSTTNDINYNGKYTITGPDGDAEKKDATLLEDGSYVIEIKAGETAEITGIPVGTEYEIQEISQEGYGIKSINVDSDFEEIDTEEIKNEREEITGKKVTRIATNENKVIDSTGTTTTGTITTTVNTTTIVNGKKVENLGTPTTTDLSPVTVGYKIGDTVTFRIKADVPETIKKLRTYKIVDTLSDGLTYVKVAKVYGVKANGTAVVLNEARLDETDNTKYTTNSDYVVEQEEQVVTIKFIRRGAMDDYTQVYVDLETTLNENTAENPNSFTLKYSKSDNTENEANTPDKPTTSENPDEPDTDLENVPAKDPVVYITTSGGTVEEGITGEIKAGTVSNKITYENEINKGSITIKKVDENKQPLLGAKFKIEKGTKEGDSSETTTPDNNETSTAKPDTTTPDNNETSTAKPDYTWEEIEELEVSGDDAECIFDELLPGHYRITETKAPSGRNLLKEPIIVDLPYAYKAGDLVNGVTVTEAGTTMNITFEVENHKGFDLPMAGVTGIRLYMCIGTIIIGISMIMCFIKIRKKSV